MEVIFDVDILIVDEGFQDFDKEEFFLISLFFAGIMNLKDFLDYKWKNDFHLVVFINDGQSFLNYHNQDTQS